MRLWDDEGGSLVLFMAIVLPVLILFFGVLFDFVRIKYGMNVVNEGVYSSVDSVLADYDKSMYGSYGLFALKGKEYGLDFSSMVRNNVKGKGVSLSMVLRLLVLFILIGFGLMVGLRLVMYWY